jgi:hypothetical protein
LLLRLTPEELQQIKREIYSFKEKYKKALMVESVTESNKLLQKIFGHRFPYRPEDIKQIVDADTIRKTSPAIIMAPIPPSTTSG